MAWADELRSTLRSALDDPDLGERLAAELFVSTTGINSVAVAASGANGSLPLEALVFSRPPGQRHIVSGNGHDAVSVRVAGAEMEFEGVNRDLLARVFGPEPFMLHDLSRFANDTSDSDIRELLNTLVQSGLLIARPASSR